MLPNKVVGLRYYGWHGWFPEYLLPIANRGQTIPTTSAECELNSLPSLLVNAVGTSGASIAVTRQR